MLVRCVQLSAALSCVAASAQPRLTPYPRTDAAPPATTARGDLVVAGREMIAQLSSTAGEPRALAVCSVREASQLRRDFPQPPRLAVKRHHGQVALRRQHPLLARFPLAFHCDQLPVSQLPDEFPGFRLAICTVSFTILA